MIYSHGTAGASHVCKGIPSQDSRRIEINGNRCLAAVADGLGSKKYSREGSYLALNVAFNHCREELVPDLSSDEISAVLMKGFEGAVEALRDYSCIRGKDVLEFNTTLIMLYYDGGSAYLFGVGDSGAVILKKDGSFQIPLEQQHDAEGHVFPLLNEEGLGSADMWTFTVADDVGGFLLTTDGILDSLLGPPIRWDMARFFMTGGDCAAWGWDDVSILDAYVDDHLQWRGDDRSIVAFVDQKASVSMQEEDYYTAAAEEIRRRNELLISGLKSVGRPSISEDPVSESMEGEDELALRIPEYEESIQQALHRRSQSPAEPL